MKYHQQHVLLLLLQVLLPKLLRHRECLIQALLLSATPLHAQELLQQGQQQLEPQKQQKQQAMRLHAKPAEYKASAFAVIAALQRPEGQLLRRGASLLQQVLKPLPLLDSLLLQALQLQQRRGRLLLLLLLGSRRAQQHG